ncbi:MAG: EAL domain-containing protein [Nannocystaceae bacterium]|nr:EAL domain-containing protein [Myxococcales bacterium]
MIEPDARLLRLAFEASPLAQLVFHCDRCVDCNDAAIQLYGAPLHGVTIDALAGSRPYREVLTPREAIEAQRAGLSERPAPWRTCVIARAVGESFVGELLPTLLDCDGDEYVHVFLREAVTRDALTGLLNRREFKLQLEALVRSAIETGSEHALLYLDLDQFKIINDVCGHHAGDALLRQLATALRAELGPDVALGRLGGDEFGVLLLGHSPAEAQRVAAALLAAIRAFRFTWEGRPMQVRASVGVAPINSGTPDATEVFASADLACHTAKDKGRNRLVVHGAAAQQRRGEMAWVHRIDTALSDDRLCLFFQRIRRARAGDGRRRLELLVRIRSEEGELVPPVVFIPPAERYQVMSRIDHWVIDRAFQWIARRHESGGALPIFHVNISGQSLGKDSFHEYVLERLTHHRLPPGCLCFEITETVAVSDVTRARAFIERLAARGCEFALDDFGRGMSSLAYLKHLPVSLLKIDGGFVKDLRGDPLDRAMVESINHIGHLMRMETIAEYVDDVETAAVLERIGVDWVQGFGIHEPEPLDDYTDDA